MYVTFRAVWKLNKTRGIITISHVKRSYLLVEQRYTFMQQTKNTIQKCTNVGVKFL